MAAAHNGHYGTVNILLERGADPDMQDNVSYTLYRDTAVQKPPFECRENKSLLACSGRNYY